MTFSPYILHTVFYSGDLFKFPRWWWPFFGVVFQSPLICCRQRLDLTMSYDPTRGHRLTKTESSKCKRWGSMLKGLILTVYTDYQFPRPSMMVILFAYTGIATSSVEAAFAGGCTAMTAVSGSILFVVPIGVMLLSILLAFKYRKHHDYTVGGPDIHVGVLL